MEALASLLQGFDIALKPINLLWGFIGVTARAGGNSPPAPPVTRHAC